METLAGLLYKVECPVVALVAQMDDKDLYTLSALEDHVEHVVATGVGGPRTRAPDVIASHLEGKGMAVSTEPDVERALNTARHIALDMGGIVCVTGSFFLVGRVKELLNLEHFR